MRASKKWKFADDYKLGADGKYVFTGDLYSLKGDYKKTYLFIFLFGLALSCAVIGAGLINAAGMNNTFYVILPYMAEVICLFVILWNITRLIYSGDRVKGYVYEPVCQRILRGSVAVAVFALLALTGSVVFTALHSFEGKMLQCILYWLLKVLTAFTGIAFNRYFKKKEWEKL
jgi:hypothetical protein